jgi:hypothetical protein
MKKYILALLLTFATCANANYLQGPIPRQHAAITPVAGSVTTASAQLIAANINRTGLACTNIGTSTAFLAYGANTAILNGGTAISPGATWWMDDYLFTTDAVNVIAASATTIACQEFQ